MRLSKKCLTIIIIMLLVSSISAFEFEQIGVNAGLNQSIFVGSEVDDNRFFPGSGPDYFSNYTIGVFTSFKMAKDISIQPELHFTRKGSIYDITETLTGPGFTQVTEGSATYVMNWVELPILLSYSVFNNLNLLMGPYAEFYVDGSYDLDYELTMDQDGEHMQNTYVSSSQLDQDVVNKAGYGFILGSSLSLGSHLSIEGRYAFGASRFFSLNLPGAENPPDARNSGLQLLASYTF